MKKTVLFRTIILSTLFPVFAWAQGTPDSLLQSGTLADCIRYALHNQPLIHQSQLDEQITENTIKSRLSEWYPQVNFGYTLQHYIQLPTSFIADATGVKRPLTTGVKYTSNLQFSASQVIFNQDVLLANKTAKDVRQQARQNTTSNKINIVVDVSKAYYDLLLTQKQVLVLDENILRLERSLQDAYNQYQGGIVDKTDYKRAQIALNNTRADRKRAQDEIDAKSVYLKQLMGYPTSGPLRIVYDSLQMEREALIDTTQRVQYDNRIEFQLLQTQRSLLQATTAYYRQGYLPSISAFGNYTPTFLNDRFADLYRSNYPNSQIGLQLTMPIFQGGKRLYNIRNANLQESRLQWDITALNKSIDAEYANALAAYKGNLAELNALKDNLALAEDVYNTLRLQYSAGIKTYLDVIIAETDLRAAQLNYLNALYQVLASKLDMQKALGTIQY